MALSLNDCYKLAQERIGEYDAHTYQLKRWLVPIVMVTVAGSFKWGGGTGWVAILVVGLGAVALVFLADMTIRTVAGRLVAYCQDIENCHGMEEFFANQEDQSQGFLEEKKRLLGRFSHVMSPETKDAWRQYVRSVWKACQRPGVAVAYLLTVVLVCLGVILAARIPG